MLPTEILASAKKEIHPYLLDSFVDNLKADGDYRLAGTEESYLETSIQYYASKGNPNKLVSVVVPDTENPSFEIDFPGEFASVIQVRDENLQSVPFEINTVDSKIVFNSGYTTPYELRYRYKLEDYFAYSVDGNGDVTIDDDTDIPDVEIVTLVKRLLRAKLVEHNNEILKMSGQIQIELPVKEDQGERVMAEDAITANVRIQPSLMSF